jgi:hypothetical protein
MTSPLTRPTFRTSPDTNEAVRSYHRRLEAALDRSITIDKFIAACVAVAGDHQDEVAARIAG